MAIVLSDIAAQVENFFAGARSATAIGGAGFFDAVVIAGLIALGLAEVVGETSEKVVLGLKGTKKESENGDKGDFPGENHPEQERENQQDG
jgi:hypothetical protein